VFTGLIEDIGEITRIEKSGTGVFLSISAPLVCEGTQEGDSISIDGACLTVTAVGDSSFTVFASRVTCAVTTLGEFRVGRSVNLERALQVHARLGGHIVQGHIDGKGTIKKMIRDENGLAITIAVDGDIRAYLVEKGSVAVDGVSLTIVTLDNEGFVVYLIPETLAKTVLDKKAPGAAVNIEIDILAKYVEKLLSREEEVKDDQLKKKLMEEGFM
jgi:riboflavin synthase